MEIYQEDTFENTVLYEEGLMTFLLIQINELNKTLVEKGISDKKLREDICQSFFYCFSMFIDANWFEESGKKLYTLIGFAEREGDEGNLKSLYITKSFTALNEYKVGLIMDYFNEMKEDISQIKKGFD